MDELKIRHDLFGFIETPFVKAPKNPFIDEARERGRKTLENFLHYRGFAAIAGDSGTGKTTFVKYLLEGRHQPSQKLVYVPFSDFNDNDLLRYICLQFGIECAHRRSQVMRDLQKHIRELNSINPILIFDDCQNASQKFLETIRLLANDGFDAHRRLSCIFIGTSEFFSKLRLKINESLCQRITCYQKFEPLNEEQTKAYLRFCLKEAGALQEIICEAGFKLIYDLCGGRMRVANSIASMALAIASEQKQSTVSLEHIHSAAETTILPNKEFKR